MDSYKDPAMDSYKDATIDSLKPHLLNSTDSFSLVGFEKNLEQSEIVTKQQPGDRFCWVCHENPALERGSFRQVGKRRRVIQMEMRYEQHINLIRFHLVQKRKAVDAVVSRMDSDVQHNCHVTKLQ